MHLKMMSRLLTAALLSVTAGCQGDEAQPTENENASAQESSATQCVRQFEGITHCATGNARLAPTTEGGLQVTGLLDATRDGVSGSFANATRWTQRVDVRFGGTQGRLSLAARSGTQVVSTLQLTPGADGSSVSMLPRFTGAPGGSDYRVNVYRDGILQGGGTQPAGTALMVRDWYNFLRWLAAISFDDRYDVIIWKTGVTASSTTQSIPGACVWRMRNEQGLFTVQLRDGRVVTGNSIEFVEQISSGQYPYTGFTGIDVKATADAYTILSETVIPAK
jgi:hypothetical protein